MKAARDYSQAIDRLREECPVRAALDVIRGRWKPSILFQVCQGPKRFSELQTAMPEVSAQVLTSQLRELEADGILTRTVFAEVPARVEYSLSAFGQSLGEIMAQLESWGESYLARQVDRE